MNLKFLWLFKEADGDTCHPRVRVTMVTRARVGISALSTIEKSKCNSNN